jgi:CNT family concentrative nucleoside transporter
VTEILHALAGLAAIVAVAWIASEDRARVPWRTVAGGIALAFALAALCLELPPAAAALESLNAVVDALDRATTAGTAMVFGYLGGGPMPFAQTDPAASFVLAFRALPIVLVTAALSALLFHVGILPAVVRAFARVLRGTLGIGGTVGVAAAANVFVGMVEAPLVVRPYLARLSRGELFIVMVGGMATIAGTVLVLYATILGPRLPGALAHLLVASVVATPVSIAIAAVMVPPSATDDREVRFEREDANAVAAIARGTAEGLALLLNIVAMLVVFIALVALVNGVLGMLPALGGAPLSLERLLGYAFAPLAWACGVPWSEVAVAGQLLGKKTVLNELLAYLDLAALPDAALSPRSRVLMTYALCGFANFGSLGIMLGGMGTMLPAARRGELSALGMKSIVAGLLSTCATAALVGLFI